MSTARSYERRDGSRSASPGVARASALARVVATLEEDVVLGRLHPRERLVEDDLIERFGVSRHVVRQALMELDRLGLLERVPNRGAQVRAFSMREIEELHSFRELLECEAARTIRLPVDAKALAEIEAIQHRHDHALRTGNLGAFFRANLAFHHRLFSCCNNAYLVEAIDRAAQRAHGMRSLVLTGSEGREAARRQHHEMIAALRGSDSDRLVALCRAHLLPPKLAYLRAFGPPPADQGDPSP